MTNTQYAAKRLFTPNKKITIDYNRIVIDNKVIGVFNFLISDKFVLSIHSTEYAWLQNVEGILTNELYFDIIHNTANFETTKTLNKIIQSLNNLAKYDAN